MSSAESDAPEDERIGVDYYLEMRKDGFGDRVGPVCEGCKVPAPQFAMKLAQDREADGLVAEAEDYGLLARTLLEETGRNGREPLGDVARPPICGRFSRFCKQRPCARCRPSGVRPGSSE